MVAIGAGAEIGGCNGGRSSVSRGPLEADDLFYFFYINKNKKSTSTVYILGISFLIMTYYAEFAPWGRGCVVLPFTNDVKFAQHL